MAAVAYAAANVFGTRLLRQLLRRGGDNVFVSPASVGLALGMVAAGARGETRAAIERALGADSGVAATEAKRLRASLARLPAGVTVELANSLWARSDLRLSNQYADEMRENFGAEVRQLDFASVGATKVVNGYVARATHGEIGNAVDAIAADSLLLLVNATYFHGLWEDQFDRRDTIRHDFRTWSGTVSEVQLMRKSAPFAYMEDAQLQAVLVPYQQNRFNLLIALPRAQLSPAGFRELVEPTTVASIRRLVRARDGLLGLPRVRLAYRLDLRAELVEMGMGRAFGPEADFAGIFDVPVNAFLSRVLHKTQLDIDEDGTTAAGSTAMDASLGEPAISKALPPFEMVVDRPFLVAITDRDTDLPLFLGVIGDPSGGV